MDDVSSRRARSALLVVNGLGAVAAAGFAAAGLARPGDVEARTSSTSLPSSSRTFWAASSAVRTWAITAPLIGALVLTGRAAPQLLAVAGMVQLGDSALGIWQRNPGMACAPAAMGVIHLMSARRLARGVNPA